MIARTAQDHECSFCLIYQDPNEDRSTCRVSFLVAPNGEKVARMQVWTDNHSAKTVSSMTACDADEPPLNLSEGHVEDGYHWICPRLAWKSAIKRYQECTDRSQEQLDAMYAQLRDDYKTVLELVCVIGEGSKLEFRVDRRVLNTSTK